MFSSRGHGARGTRKLGAREGAKKMIMRGLGSGAGEKKTERERGEALGARKRAPYARGKKTTASQATWSCSFILSKNITI